MSITRRTARALVVAATAAALAGPAATATAVTTGPVPEYTCDNLRADISPVGRWDAFGNCEVVHGNLPEHGPVHGEFRIWGRFSEAVVLCEFVAPASGFADLPFHVEGRHCHRLDT
ncbi:hypothetical protein ABZW30_45475 [Kitasatospora sp. NPDC004669]|uniref:hypothetical protein n=1 Tax=Kitasatospora sp. NPDC004669 TaxID=3154555 RepID=UPI0033A2DE73